MPATIVVGGQYGSEGKGKVTALLARRAPSPWLVRCGGPNSGHTVTLAGQDVVLRQVPSSIEPHRGMFCLSAGCVVDVPILRHELDILGIERDRIVVDPRAVLVTDEDREAERRGLIDIASTCSGTGAALMNRMSRKSTVALAGGLDELKDRCRVESVASLLHRALATDEDVIIEGTQGFELSLLHGPDYPFVTARDTTASGFASEVGLSPRDVHNVVMVVRTFPIRVGGPSGPLPNEITWDEVRSLSGAPHTIPEVTSVTKRLRRVAHFDMDSVRTACRYNRPTSLAIMGLDRLDYANTGVTSPSELTNAAGSFIRRVVASCATPVELVGTGFPTADVALVNELAPLKQDRHAWD